MVGILEYMLGQGSFVFNHTSTRYLGQASDSFYMILSWSSLILLYQSACTARINTHINATYLLHPLCVPDVAAL